MKNEDMQASSAAAAALINEFRFLDLFASLGWKASSISEPLSHMAYQAQYCRRIIAELSDIRVLEVWTPGKNLAPTSIDILQIYLSKDHPNSLMIYLDNPEEPTEATFVWGLHRIENTKILSMCFFKGDDPQAFSDELLRTISELVSKSSTND